VRARRRKHILRVRAGVFVAQVRFELCLDRFTENLIPAFFASENEKD
jgi:hypothetical protein